MTVVCQSDVETTIMWWQKTLDTNFGAAAVNPAAGQDFSIESCATQPSGFSKSTLSRFNMSLNTRGMYQCRDDSSSYAIWATVIYSMFV